MAQRNHQASYVVKRLAPKRPLTGPHGKDTAKEMRWEIRIPGRVRLVLIGLCILGFAAGSLEPNTAGGVLALISALLIVFLFFFTEASSKDADNGVLNEAEMGADQS